MITSDPKEIEVNLLKTMQEIQVDEQWPWIKLTQFPKLEDLDNDEMKEILSGFAIYKAIAFDGCSDIIFQNQPRTRKATHQSITANKLKDIWKTELHKIQEVEDTWDTRLVPLNKVFP